MRNSEEVQIEKYVRFPEELSPDEFTRLKQAVSENQEVKMLADWFAAFYEVMDESGSEAVLLNNNNKNYVLESRGNGELTVSTDEFVAENGESEASRNGLTPVMISNVSRRSSTRSGFVLAKTETGHQSVEVIQGDEEVTVVVDNGNTDAEYGILLLESEDESTIWKIKNGLAAIPGELFRDKKLTMAFYLLNRNQKSPKTRSQKVVK